METLYNIAIRTAERLLPLGSLFGEKMKLFSEGRKNVLSSLEEHISPNDRYIWIHAASLGEFEQAVPIIEGLKKDLPEHKCIVSFFSPSGYEIKKNTSLVDFVTYLPLDTPNNARRFLDLVKPEWALFIKYEFWPNYLSELKRRDIKTLLVSGSFRKDQIFFKTHGKWMRKYLNTFNHFFVQNSGSKELLASIGFKNATISGDTRFDRVSRQIEQDNTLNFIEEFKDNQLCLVAGSTWPADEELLLDFINSNANIKIIIAPHTIQSTRIKGLQERIIKPTVLFSAMKGKNLASYKVFIIDTIGLLSKIYSYAELAYVGGAAGTTGLHNILEPATFGVPVVIGKNYDKFPEAKQLRKLAGLYSVDSSEEAQSILGRLVSDKNLRQKSGLIAEHFIQSNTGTTKTVIAYIHNIS